MDRQAAVYRFGEFELDVPRVEVRRAGAALPVEPLVFEVLRYLVEHRDRVVGKSELLDEVWGRREVSESTLAGRIKFVRKLLGDDGRTQAMIRTVHGLGYRFVGTVDDGPPPRGAGHDVRSPTRVRFVDVAGGARLAVGAAGRGPTLVKAANWLTHVHEDTDSPVWRHWVRDLSRHHTYVRYDARGCGLSDRDLRGVDLTDLDLWVDDLLRVVDALELPRCALMGLSQGGPVAMAFAARYPERVSHLILVGTYARGMNRRGDRHQARQAALQVDLATVGWASDDDRFLEVFTRQFIPDAGPRERRWFNALQKSTADGETAARLEAAMHDVDVSALARTLEVPTLVMHCDEDVAVPFEEGRHLAALIPGAQFYALPGGNHIILEHDAAWPQFVARIERFTGATDR